MPLSCCLVCGMFQAVGGKLLVHKFRALVAMDSEIKGVWEVGMVVIDLCQETLDGLCSLGLRAEQGSLDDRVTVGGLHL